LSLANNVEFLRHLPKPGRFGGFAELGRNLRPDLHSPLAEVKGFGTNPGALRMFSYVPAVQQQPRALVVVLHGCGQSAAGYDVGSGWSTLAKHYGFALLLPEQQPSNNANTCFNWFNPEDIARERGEACSIRQMIARMVADHGIDPHRIFVTGLSAGGAMTTVMLATYPELFCAGAVIAGLPFGVASNVREALSGMRASRARSAGELGDLVRKASSHKGAWPKLSVWHGSADRTVYPGNANEIVKQWLDVHGLPLEPMSEGVIDGHPRQVWWDASGETVVESYTITDMAHGTPLGTADNDKRYGTQGAFMIEAGISSSYHIAKFFGLTDWIRQPKPVASRPAAAPKPVTSKPVASKPVTPKPATPKLAVADSPSAKLIPMVSPIPSPLPIPLPNLGKTVWQTAHVKPAPEPKDDLHKHDSHKHRRVIDVNAVITRALTAAGLMK
jgi:poly(hydroxyalkanoate) depolymerase family esterase